MIFTVPPNSSQFFVYANTALLRNCFRIFFSFLYFICLHIFFSLLDLPSECQELSPLEMGLSKFFLTLFLDFFFFTKYNHVQPFLWIFINILLSSTIFMSPSCSFKYLRLNKILQYWLKFLCVIILFNKLFSLILLGFVLFCFVCLFVCFFFIIFYLLYFPFSSFLFISLSFLFPCFLHYEYFFPLVAVLPLVSFNPLSLINNSFFFFFFLISIIPSFWSAIS